MKHLITLLLSLCSIMGVAQTVTNPPSGSKPYGTPVAVPDGRIMVGRSGSFTYITPLKYTDSLISALSIAIDSKISNTSADVFRTNLTDYGRIGSSQTVDINSVVGARAFLAGSGSSNLPTNNTYAVINLYQAGTVSPQLLIAAAGTGMDDNFWYTARQGAAKHQVASRAWSLNEITSRSSKFDVKKISDNYKFNDVIRNASLEPDATGPSIAMNDNGDMFIGTLDNESWLSITIVRRDGSTYTRRLGKIRNLPGGYNTDNHNAPAILIDNRNGAQYPIIVFQTDHQFEGTQYWRFTSFDIENEAIPTPLTIPGFTGNSGKLAYTQSYRSGDNIYVFNRVQGSSPDINNGWRACYSNDNGDTWVQREIFDSAGGSPWMYMYVSQIRNSPLLNLTFASTSNGTETRGAYLRLDMDSGELSNLSTTLVSDVPDYIENSTSVINPYNDGLLLFDPPAGDRVSVPVVSINETGNLISVATYYNDMGEQFTSAVEFNRNNGSIVETGFIDTADVSGGHSYVRKLLMYDNNIHKVYTLTWKEDYKDNSTRVAYGEGTIYEIDISDIGNPVKNIYKSSYNKLDRPEALPDFTGLAFCEISWNDGFRDFDGDIIIDRLEENDSYYSSRYGLIGGNNTWTGSINLFAPMSNTISYSNGIQFVKNNNGYLMAGTDAGTSSVSFFLRGYSSSGVQLSLNSGGVQVPSGWAPSTNNDLTPKSYVDDNFVDKSTNQTIDGDKSFTGTLSAANINELPTRSLNTSLGDVIAGETLTYTTAYTGVSSGDVIAVGVSGSIGETDLIITASSTSTPGQVIVKFYNPTGSDISIGNISIKLKAFK